ncbi:het domain-containing protein [Podospora aff. communis PSN243]|uniref:Het domain-containing protein n=1 Tax=Podospora aff. communis PSN243 TaxID=3040156 RepID=A0AAV9GM91_9PEZI|nr:het domain-containing protein [Podospora aff. communis PSN243]
MRLINKETLELSEFFGSDIPTYVILSHTWTKEEVTLREWSNPSDATTSKTGYKKICMACSLARRHGYSWIWVDTNCIDKTSSAELSEAINSMFGWYRNAATCFAYLEDVTKDNSTEEPDKAVPRSSIVSQLCASRWFTRGWTLQELIAPSSLGFYSREWAWLGNRADFVGEISDTTGIDKEYLYPREVRNTGLPIFLEAPVATRMSWVSKRQTTRIEDIAYCMLGIFDINMPLLYGEGPKAFLRLQEEIIRRQNDHTIFAWGTGFNIAHTIEERPQPMGIGVLAPSPLAFLNTKRASKILSQQLSMLVPSPYSLTNSGLSIKLPVLRTAYGCIAILDTDLAAISTKFDSPTSRQVRSLGALLPTRRKNIRPPRVEGMDLAILKPIGAKWRQMSTVWDAKRRSRHCRIPIS